MGAKVEASKSKATRGPARRARLKRAEPPKEDGTSRDTYYAGRQSGFSSHFPAGRPSARIIPVGRYRVKLQELSGSGDPCRMK